VSRPVPTWLFHITHVDRLAGIVTDGLLADSVCAERGVTGVPLGHDHIKARRLRRTVPLKPGGVVGDYVPFYFAPRSPMLYAVARGNVAGAPRNQDSVIYLVTSTQRLVELGGDFLTTDRNAALDFAAYRDNDSALDDPEHIDWDLMSVRMWNNTPADPDRMERRMAECLVHQRLPWTAVVGVAVRNEAIADRVRADLATLGQSTPVAVSADWYF
jgi:hypothetical protein